MDRTVAVFVNVRMEQRVIMSLESAPVQQGGQEGIVKTHVSVCDQ
jgi:hypothetical protein